MGTTWGDVLGEVLRIGHRGRGDEAGTRAKVQGHLGVKRRTHSTCLNNHGEQPRPQTPRPPSTNKVGRGGLGPGLFADLSPVEGRKERERERESERERVHQIL